MALNDFIANYLIKWIDSLYRACTKKYDQPSASLRLQVILCRKVYDILLVCLSTQDETTRTALFQQIFSKTKPFAFCVLFHHLDQLSEIDNSPIYNSTITQLRSHLVDGSVPIIDVLLDSQIEILFEKSQSKSLDCDILVNILAFFLNQGELNYARSDEQNETQIGNVLSQLHKHLHQSDMIISATIPFPSFLLDFPLMCREIYILLFNRPHLLNRIENFEKTFINLTKLFFRQMFDSTINSSSENDPIVKSFVTNTISFWTFSFTKLFDTLPKYEASLNNLVHELIDVTIGEIVLSQRWNFHK